VHEVSQVVKALTETLERSVEETQRREMADHHAHSVIAKLRQVNPPDAAYRRS
jgi:hypothetical protein